MNPMGLIDLSIAFLFPTCFILKQISEIISSFLFVCCCCCFFKTYLFILVGRGRGREREDLKQSSGVSRVFANAHNSLLCPVPD